MKFITRVEHAKKIEAIQTARLNKRYMAAVTIEARTSNARIQKKTFGFTRNMMTLMNQLRAYQESVDITRMNNAEVAASMIAAQKNLLKLCRKNRMGVQGVTGAMSSCRALFPAVMVELDKIRAEFGYNKV